MEETSQNILPSTSFTQEKPKLEVMKYSQVIIPDSRHKSDLDKCIGTAVKNVFSYVSKRTREIKLQELVSKVAEQENKIKQLELKLAFADQVSNLSVSRKRLNSSKLQVEKCKSSVKDHCPYTDSSLLEAQAPALSNISISGEPLVEKLCRDKSLDDIMQANSWSLELMKANKNIEKLFSTSTAEFPDINQLKTSLAKLNPNWGGTADELLAIMKAYNSGKEVNLTPKIENTNTFSAKFNDFNTDVTHTTSGIKSPTDKPTILDTKKFEDSFQNVTHNHTHTLEVQRIKKGSNFKVRKELKVIQIYKSPPVHVVSDFLWEDELDFLMKCALHNWSPANSETETKITKFLKGESDIVDRISFRISSFFRTDVTHMEELFLMRYKHDVKSKPHLEKSGRKSTCIIYLNDIKDGGETNFLNLGFQISPQRGLAVFWQNVVVSDHDEIDMNRRDPRMLHSSSACINESKYILVGYLRNSM